VAISPPNTNTWSSGSPVNVARDQDPVAVTLGSKIYLIGGTAGCGGATVTTVESLDLGTNVWTALPAASNLPLTLTGNNHCAAAAGTKIYYFQAAGIGVFDTSTNTWSVLPANPLLSPSSYCKAVPYGTNKIQISGPGNGSADANSQRVLTFDATSNTISVGARTTVSDAEHGSAVLHNQVVLTGGDFAPTSVQVIDALALFSTSPLPSPRDDHLSGVVNGKIYLFGGESGATTTPAVLIGTSS
jgi:Kelch motif protein